MKRFNKLFAVTLSIAVFASALFVGGVMQADLTVSGETEAVGNAIDLDYGETYTFGFDSVPEYTVNTTPSADGQGNVFYPWRSGDGDATAGPATITYGGKEITALELSSSYDSMYIPTDENGLPLVIEPNSSYKVNIVSYAKAISDEGQIFMGGGIYESCSSAYSDGGTKTFPDSIAYNNSTYDMKALYPIFRTASHQYSGSSAYWEDYRERSETLYFSTGDFDVENGSFEMVASDGETYKFGSYFGIFCSFRAMTLSEYAGESVLYIDSISVTKTAGMENGESYTFDFSRENTENAFTVTDTFPALKSFSDEPAPAEITNWDGTKTAPSEGSGSESDPFIITNAAELAYAVSYNDLVDASKVYYYKLANDIYINDPSAEEWYTASDLVSWPSCSAGNSTSSGGFMGHLDGNGHAVYGLYFKGATSGSANGYGGIIAKLSGGASVKNIGLESSYLYGYDVGGIFGGRTYGKDLTATIENCYVDDSVILYGTDTSGGIFGWNSQSKLTVKNCYSLVQATTKSGNEKNAGGLIGAVANNVSGVVVYQCYTDTEICGREVDRTEHISVTDCYKGIADNTGAVLIDPADMQGENALTVMRNLGYSLEFEAGKTTLTDGEGNKFYPYHTSNYGAVVGHTEIDVTTASGSTESVSTLKISSGSKSSGGNGYIQFIPTDENGMPFVVEPNTKYEVTAVGYVEKAWAESQTMIGAGALNAASSSYGDLDNTYNGANTWYYTPKYASDKGTLNVNYMASGYPMWRASSFMHGSSNRSFTGFDQTNTDQYRVSTLTFLTTDFTEKLSHQNGSGVVTDTLGDNLVTADLWQKNTYASGTDPYSEEVALSQYDVGTYFVIAVGNTGCTFYFDSITITKVSQTASVTYDANGGKFSDSTTTKTVTENVGALFTVGTPENSSADLAFKGWSLSPDGVPVSRVSAAHNGKTLYAIWGDPTPHPEDGVYNTWKRVVEFDEYKVENNVNTFVPTDASYGQYKGVPYFTVIDDPDEEGDSLLHYFNHSKASNWYANWCFTPTYNGVSGTTAGQDDYNILPTSTTFKVTARVRINDTDGGTANFTYYYGAGNGRNSYDSTNSSALHDLASGLTKTDGFVEIEAYFTTPAAYDEESSGAVSNRLYMGFRAPGYQLDYDLDYIIIEKVTTTELYVKKDGSYQLLDTYTGAPGNTLTIPEFYSAENYSPYDATGSSVKMRYGNWFSDEECTASAVMKFADYDVSIYCDGIVELPTVSTENQEMFVGFDTYTQRTEGLKNAVVTDDTYSTGKYSLKASDGAAFELKNDHTLELLDGKTYRVDFAYKTDKEATLGIGLAKGLVANGVDAKNSVILKATDDWTAASVIFTADGVVDNSVLAAKISSATDATVYIDTMIVSSVTESVGVEAVTSDNGEGLRFMLSYTGTETVKMAGVDYTVTEHGVIVKGQDVDTALTLDNADENGIFLFAQTDMSKNWSVNPITGTTVYSAYLDGFNANDDYKVSVRGYIKLSDGTVYYTDTLTASVTDIPAAADIIPEGADLSNYYVYLPEGTTLPEDAAYTVTTYDDTFTANSAVENNVVTEGSYATFSARPDFSEISVPSELKYMVHAGTKDELYYGLNAQVVSEKISQVGKDTVNYLFITDIHFGSDLTSAQNVALLNQAKLMTKMANENDNIDFVVIGGDNTTGMYGSKADCVKWTQAALDPFLECTKPVFVLMGNHDDNSYHLMSGSNKNYELYEERIITDLDWQNYIIDRYTNRGNITVVQDDPEKRANSKYFYYDLEGKKTRVIALDALDYEARYDENGFVLGDLDGDGLLDGMPIRNADGDTDYGIYNHGCNYWGYSADQVRWLAEDALGSLPADYDVIFVSHMGIDLNTNAYGTKIWFSENIREIIKAYNSGGTYTASLTDNWGDAVSVSADFAGKSGDILFWQFGHQHIELSLYESDVDLWQICTPSANVGQTGTQTYEALFAGSVNNKGLPWRVYTRKLGGSSEACFNAMSVSRERVYRLTVGEGNNEKLVYSK